MRAWLPPQRFDPMTREELLRFVEAPLRGPRSAAAPEGSGRKVPSHALLMKLLVQTEMSEEEASRHWRLLCAHREALAEKLGRDPGAAVAALDYFTRQQGYLANPVLVDGLTAERTLSAASRDGLTGLVSSGHFQVLLKTEARRAARSLKDFSLVLLDLDDFRGLNERWGRETGDAALKEVAAILRARLRDPDVAGRAGGAHFSLILPGTRRTGAYVVAERIRRAVEERFHQPLGSRQRLLLTLSAGAATFPRDGDSREELVRHAFRALMAARSGGGNRVALDDHDQRGAVRLKPLGRSLTVKAVRSSVGGSLGLKAVELSGTGALLESKEPLRVGEDLDLLFPELFPSPGPSIPARVERQWKIDPASSEEPGDGEVRLGVRFVPATPEKRDAVDAVLTALQGWGIEQGAS